MADILTVTLNPALDVSSTVPKVVPEDKLRCSEPVLDAGGGGINVARAIGALGGEATALVALAGHRGEHFLDLLAQEPLIPLPFWIKGETRQSFAVTSRETGEQFRFITPGPRWNPEQAEAILDAIEEATTKDAYVVLSGSQPPGVPRHFPTQLAARIENCAAKLILDTSGAALRALLGTGVATQHVLRLDGAESEALAGRQLPTREAVADFAQELIARGIAEVVVLAMGADGSILATADGRWHARTETVPVRSKVGAGDSFVGSFTHARNSGADWPEALVQGVAAASAAVMTDATELCEKPDVDRLAASAQLSRT